MAAMPTSSAEKPHLREVDVERAAVGVPPTSIEKSGIVGKIQHWNTLIDNLASFEARGLTRVPDDERQAPSGISMVQMLLLWFSANMTINNLAVAILGPLAYGLGFADSAWCSVVGVFFGSATTAYMSTWGPASGNRTMVVTRFFMGYYPSKITTLLNIILMVGYCTIDCIIAGQVLSAVSGGTMSIVVGVVIVDVIQCLIASFGLKWFHIYERFAWLPQLIALFILVGSAGPNFNTSLQSSVTGTTLAANRLSFLSLCFYVPNSWGAASSDYYVYYPVNTPKWKTFLLTMGGLSLSFWFVDLIGVGLGCGVAVLPTWADAYTVSSGALITEGFSPLGEFGKFCAVVIAFGVIANCVPGTYSAALGCQIMGRWGEKLPRWVWAVVLCAIQLVCGVAGRNQLYIIFTNFLALMGYWLSIMVCIVLEEHLIFRPKLDWTLWADRTKLPIGIAALVAFLLGWMGTILGMYQIWYTGPLAVASGDAGVGMWVGCAFSLISYPPIRWFELKRFGR